MDCLSRSATSGSDITRDTGKTTKSKQGKPMTRQKLFTSVLTTAVMVASLSLATNSARAADAPNIVLIMSDDMGFSDIGCYGNEINTPNHLENIL